MSNQVEYRPVIGAERYKIGSDGSLIGPSGRTLNPGRDTYGYRQALIYSTDGSRRMRKVHQLVLEAFTGPRPTPKHQCAHWDGNPENNAVTNLRWATAKENIADKIRHGRATRTNGEINGQVKLTAEKVREIRARCAAGAGQYVIASEYGVKQPTISNIITGKTWSHLE
jgi:hypothetical protein